MAESTLEDVEQTVAGAEEQGYYGETPDYDRDAYTLTTGPESPSSLEATLAAKKAEIDAQLDALKERAKERAASAKSKAKDAGERAHQRHAKRTGEA
jgi:hypothetical protein